MKLLYEEVRRQAEERTRAKVHSKILVLFVQWQIYLDGIENLHYSVSKWRIHRLIFLPIKVQCRILEKYYSNSQLF